MGCEIEPKVGRVKKSTVERQARVRPIERLVGESPAQKRVTRSSFALRRIQVSRSHVPANGKSRSPSRQP